MTLFEWALITLLYFVCSFLYSLTYIWVYGPSEEDVWLGIMALLWPLYLVLDVLLQIARGFGKSYKIISNKIINRTR